MPRRLGAISSGEGWAMGLEQDWREALCSCAGEGEWAHREDGYEMSGMLSPLHRRAARTAG